LSDPALDIVAIGNAIVDVLARADDAFLASHALTKGGMQLIDAATSELLYANMGPGMEISGGSAANTLAGMAALGCRCAFIGQVRDDALGKVFAHDIRSAGIRFDTPVRTQEPPTASCLILVTPDGQRTMNTFLGASQFLPAAALDRDLIRAARILYLEGYLWDPAEPRAAMRDAIAEARGAGTAVALTLSDVFVIDRHRADFLALLDAGAVDILFANEGEIRSLRQTDDFEAAVAATAAKVPTLVVTRGEQGAIALQGGRRHAVPAEPVARVIDTTGAGDLFAAGYLAGHLAGRDPAHSLRMGAIAAAEIISHFGARPESDLRALMGVLG
jgi:sugar/nucleoside kinase (ribokinase family)